MYKFFIEDICLYANKIFVSNKTMFLIAFITSLVSISAVVSFFIPIKIILILENPSILAPMLSENLSLNIVFSGLILVFCISMYISIFGKLYINKRFIQLKQNLWEIYKNKKDGLFKKASFDRVLKKIVAIYADLMSICMIIVLIIMLDYIVACFLLVCFIGFLAHTQKTANNTDKTYDYQTVIQTLGNGCFYVTFILILTLYFSGIKIVLINTLLAFMLSRVYFRSLQQFAINSISLHKEFYKK